MPACTSLFIPGLDGHASLDQDELVELWHVLSTVPDPRDPRGVRHAFATILTLAIGAVLAGCCSVAAVAAWASDLPPRLATRVGVRRRPPRLSTFARTLIAVDPDVLDAVLGAWLAARAGAPAGLRALAVDGKTARGARRDDGTQVHLVACLNHATGTVVGQVEVASKGSEITAFAAVLDRVDLHGCVVTADALHTQKAHAHYLAMKLEKFKWGGSMIILIYRLVEYGDLTEKGLQEEISKPWILPNSLSRFCALERKMVAALP